MKKLLLPLLSILLFTACKKEISTDKANEEIAGAAAKKQAKITVCHYDAVTGTSKTITISLNAWPAHQAHGDVRLDDQDGDGYVLNNECGFGQQGDCDDNNAAIKPGATEICGNSIDDNCNGQVDEGCIPSVTICIQTWMLYNLDVTTYRDGTAIPEVTDPTTWAGLTTGAWCYSANNSANGTVFGKLYNWYAVNDPRGLAPSGWHIPSDGEWSILSTCLDAISPTGNVGGKMKSTSGWFENGNGTNSSGFTGLPGGSRIIDGTFFNFGRTGYWWSSTEPYEASAWHRSLDYSNNVLSKNFVDKRFGFSVRCVRD